MMLEKSKDNYELIELAEQIMLRQAVTQERALTCMNLAFAARFRINWRTFLSSSESMTRLWEGLSQFSIDYDQLQSMTDEFIFRVGSISLFSARDGIQDHPVLADMVRSLAWPTKADALPLELRDFTAKPSDYMVALKNNAWVVFLYLVYMSDATRLLTLAYPKIGAGVTVMPATKEGTPNEAARVSQP